MRAVDHDAGETAVYAALAEFKAVAMIEVEHYLGIFPTEFLGIGHGTLCHVAQQGSVGIVAGAFGNLQDYGRFFFGSGFDDSLELLHIVEVESRDSIAALDGFGKHFLGVDKA